MPLGANAIVLVSYRSIFNQQRYLFTQTYRISATTSTQTPALDTIDLVQFFTQTGANDLLTKYAACLGSNVNITRVTCQGIWPLRFVSQSAALAVPGSMVTSATTGNIAGVITLRTELAGRSQIANKHIGPPGTAGYADGLCTATLFAPLVALAIKLTTSSVVNLTTAGQTITIDPCIFHKGPGTSNLVTGEVVSDRIGTMRRRTVRVGE